MSEQKSSAYMHELDSWLAAEILRPLGEAWLHYSQASEGGNARSAQGEIREVEANAKKLIRQRVLESYRNGQAANGKQAEKGGRYGRRPVH